MLVIRDVMSSCAAMIRPQDTLQDAVKVLCELHLSGAPVVAANGAVVGFISEGSLMDVLFDERSRRALVSGYMSTDVYVLHPNDTLADATSMFALYGVRRLPVVENGVLVGIVTRRDLLQHAVSGAVPFNEPLAELIPSIHEFA